MKSKKRDPKSYLVNNLYFNWAGEHNVEVDVPQPPENIDICAFQFRRYKALIEAIFYDN